MLTLEKARANRTPIEWDDYEPPVPAHGTGVREFRDYDLAELREYILAPYGADTINDVADKDFDRHVQRTAQRPGLQ